MTLCLAAVVAGCGDGDGSSATVLEPGDPDGHPEPLGAGPDEARAGRLGAGELPPDPNGQGLVEEGDFVLANDQIAVVIEDVGVSDLWDVWGGKPVGMGRMEDGAIVDPVNMYEMLLSIGQYTVDPESVTVINDGSDGRPAHVRALGTLGLVKSLGELIGLAAPFSNSAFEGMEAAIDYQLAPGDQFVQVTYHIDNTEDATLETNSLHLFFQESRLPLYAPGDGFAFNSGGSTSLIAYADKGEPSFGWETPPDAPDPGESLFVIRQSGATVFKFPTFEMQPERVHSQAIGRLHVGDGPDVDGVLQAVADGRGETWREITGTVTNADDSPAEGVSIHVTYDEGGESQYLTRTTTASDGTYAVHVPADQTVELATWRQGDLPAGPTTSGPDDAVVDFQLDEVGTIQVEASDSGVPTQPLPVRIEVIPDGDPDYVAAPPEYGEPKLLNGRLHVEFPIDGQATLRAPEGMHKVVVSRGFDYKFEELDVPVAAGTTDTWSPPLERVVDRTGYMCADFHVHAANSPDAGDPHEFKIRSAMGDGVDIPVLSEHRWVGDFEETIMQMDPVVAEWVYGVSSLELTTFVWGHMGVFPLAVQRDLPNHGYIDFTDMGPAEVFNEVRTRESGTMEGVEPALIINHARDFGGAALGEYFSAVDYSPTTGNIGNPEMWDDSFRLIEVFNDTSFDQMLDEGGNPDKTLLDWFSMLNHFPDRPFFAVGSSDSHFVLQKNSPVGYPRTCVNVGMDAPEDLRASDGSALLRNVATAGEMTVNGGVFVTAEAAEAATPMGGTVTNAAGIEDVNVHVQAPCWVDVDELEVWVNGELYDVLPLGTTNGGDCSGPVRYDSTVDGVIEVPVDDTAPRTWVVFHARGDTAMDPVLGGRLPFGVTNPIFFEP
ncbi:MAG: hypothetical protein ACODAG_10050 [Myxococcota bacterium]